MANKKNQVIEKYEKNGKTLYRFKLSIYHNGYNTSISGSDYATKKLALEGLERKKTIKIREIEQRPKKSKVQSNGDSHQDLTLEDVFKLYNDSSPDRPSTKDTRQSVFYSKIWNPYFSKLNKKVYQLTLSDIIGFKSFIINNYKTQNGKKLNNTGINTTFTYLKITLQKAKKLKLLSAEDCQDFIEELKPLNRDRKKQIVYGEKEFWDAKGFEKFFDNLPETKRELIYKVFFKIQFLGLRMGEVRALKVEDIYFSQSRNLPVISITKNLSKKNIEGLPKTLNSKRTIAIPQEVYDLVNDYVKERDLKPDDYLFLCLKKTSVVSEGNIRDVYRNTIEKAGLPYMTPHQHRHRVAFLLYMNDPNRNAANIAGFLGHSVKVLVEDYLMPSSDGDIYIAKTLSEDLK